MNASKNNKKKWKQSSPQTTLRELRENAAKDKEHIEALKQAIFKKIKTPKMAQKAAFILSHWSTKKSADTKKDKKSA